jgi:UDP-glucose 4-epimerase
VVDLAKAHVVAIARLLNDQNKANCEFFNVGTGNGVSVLEIINSFERSTGEKVPHRITDRREGDIEQIYADTSYSNRELGWQSEKSLDETLLSAWNWQKTL